MKIYFATTTGQNSTVDHLCHEMTHEIKRYGQIMCPWQVTSSVMTNVTRYPDQQIHDQSVRQLEIADVLIAEVTRPSLGVGYELCLAEQLDLPNVILYNSNRSKASAIINGARKLNAVPYHDWRQAKQIVDRFLDEFKS